MVMQRAPDELEREFAADRIGDYMCHNSVQLKDFANRIHRSPSTLSGFMNGRRGCLGIPALQECAKQLGISFELLISPMNESDDWL